MSDYRVILTGGLIPGYGQDQALQGLAELFRSSPDTLRQVFEGDSYPVKGRFSAEQALELQRSLERIGVRARIERASEQTVELEMRDLAATTSSGSTAERPSTDPDYRVSPADPGQAATRGAELMHCPACGHEQSDGESCRACGIVFADFNERRAVRRPPVQARRPDARRSRPRPTGRSSSAVDGWDDEWVGLEDDQEPDERHFLGLFAGPTPARYLGVFERFKRGPRSRFPLSWNWGAVFSPFLWAMYRKLWFWALVIGVFEVLLPIVAFVLGALEGFSHKFLYLGWAGLIGSRLFWPAVVDFLYFRYARSSIMRLHRMAPNYAADIDIATAGGVSHTAVFVGIAFSLVFGLFFWSTIESMNLGGSGGFDSRISQTLEQASGPRPDGDSGLPTGMQVEPRSIGNKWAETRRGLRALGLQVNQWLEQNNKIDNPKAMNLYTLRQQMRIPKTALQDGWGGEIQYIPDTEGYRLVSAGPDGLFGTADDVQYRRTLN
jgi:hypothetical protein